MLNELEDCILIIDSHEEANKKDKTRIRAIEEWATKYGICSIEHRELPLCDYSLMGEFRDKDINLGVEYKSWDNFLSDATDDMEDKITRSQEMYSEVAFFIEAGNYTFKPHEDDCHCTMQFSDMAKAGFRKRGIKETELPATKTLAGYEGFLETMSLNGIHVRQLRSEAQFPYSLHNLLIYLSNAPHLLKVKELSYENWLVNHYMTLPGIGYVRAKKLILNFPNPAWLCSASEESLISALGRTIGRVIYQHLNSHSLETDAWKKGSHLDGTPRLDPNMCESTACQSPGITDLPCDMKKYDKVCRFPELRMKLAKERGYPSKKKPVKEKPPAEPKPCKNKGHQDFKLWKATGFKCCGECQYFTTNESGITKCLKHSDYVVYVTTHACIEHVVKNSSYPSEVPNSPPNTSEINTPEQAIGTKGSPGVSPHNSIIELECKDCGDTSLYVTIDPVTHLCPTCQQEANKERHKELVEVAKEIIKYMVEFDDGLTAQQICDHFECGESSADKKDLLVCLKKMTQIGIISSKYKGVFVVTPKGQTFAGVTENSSHAVGGFCEDVCPSTVDNSSHSDGFGSPQDVFPSTDLQATHKPIQEVIQKPVDTQKAEGLSFSPSAPQITDLTLGLREWFDTAHTLPDTVEAFRAWKNGEEVFNKVVQMEKDKTLRRFTDKTKGMMWINAVKADKEMDIGV